VIATRRAGERQAVTGELTITRLNDQHAYVSDPAGTLHVGDLVGIGVRHPCLGLDRWRWLPLIDDRDDVVGAVELLF
jgi:D-serine deaminase-like pyridoxal phosphate-dependent protein